MRENKMKDMNPNLGTTERILSLMGGSYMLYDALVRRRKSLVEAVTAGYLLYRGATGYCPMYEAIVPEKAGRRGKRIDIETNVRVNKPRSEVYSFWRKLENLPLFMKHLERVTMNGDSSMWEARIPGGLGTVSWEAVIVEEEEDERIKWKSLPGSTIENEGTVTFRDAGDSATDVNVKISYSTPLGAPGDEIAKLLTPVFKNMVTKDIRGLKQYMETGEVATTEGQPSGR